MHTYTKGTSLKLHVASPAITTQLCVYLTLSNSSYVLMPCCVQSNVDSSAGLALVRTYGSVYTSLLNYSYTITLSLLLAKCHKLTIRRRGLNGGWGVSMQELGRGADDSVGHKKLPLTHLLWAPLSPVRHQTQKYLIAQGTESI